MLAFNRPVDAATAEEVAKLFVECIAAPGFEPGALEKFAAKKNLRLLELVRGEEPGEAGHIVLKPISGGVLVQDADLHEITEADLKIVSERQPTAEEIRSMLFAWKVCKHVKSNAIVFTKGTETVGIGAGQMSRVDAVKIAVIKAATANLSLKGSVFASDAFFPFPDSVEEAAKAGATAVIQPGGSVRDGEVTAVANKLGLAMVTTGIRHFRHYKAMVAATLLSPVRAASAARLASPRCNARCVAYLFSLHFGRNYLTHFTTASSFSPRSCRPQGPPAPLCDR